MTRIPFAGLAAAAVLAACLAPPALAAGDSIIDANILEVAPGDAVPVSRIPDGVYLRSVNDPNDDIWRRLPEYRTHLAPAPPVHESVDLRWDENDPGLDVYFKIARTSDRFYVRLRWFDPTHDVATLTDRFRDGAAVQFAIGGEDTFYMMGTGPDEPVNIWYWRSDLNEVTSLAAGGPGSTTWLPDQPVSGASRYRKGDKPATNEWIVVMSRPIEVTGEYQVSFDRPQVPMAFALWQGSAGQRDGLKNASEDWIFVDLGGQ